MPARWYSKDNKNKDKRKSIKTPHRMSGEFAERQVRSDGEITFSQTKSKKEGTVQ